MRHVLLSSLICAWIGGTLHAADDGETTPLNTVAPSTHEVPLSKARIAAPRKDSISAPVLARPFTPGDPETARNLANEEDAPPSHQSPELKAPPAAPEKPLLVASEPERGRRIPEPDEPAPAGTVPAVREAAKPGSQAQLADKPRFEINSVADIEDRKQREAAEKLDQTRAQSLDAALNAQKAKETLSAPKPEDKTTAKTAQKSAPAKGGEQDPQRHFDELIQEITGLREKLKTLEDSARKRMQASISGMAGMNIHGEHETKVYLSLQDKHALGGVNVSVFDPKTKAPLYARIRLADFTEIAAHAPLDSGFWCSGTARNLSVVPGLVRAEVHHGGRFFPTYAKGLDVLPGQITPLEVKFAQPPELNFAAHGWLLADLQIALHAGKDERNVWFGSPPTLNDLILGAKAEGVHILGVEIPFGDEAALTALKTLSADPNPEVLLLPVFPGPRNAFNGCGLGLGVKNWDGLRLQSAVPSVSLREGFEAIRARDGLAVIRDGKINRRLSIENDILPVFKQLKEQDYFGGSNGEVKLFGPAEMPFDTVTAGYDLLAFDGSDQMEAVWFNLLNEGAPVNVIGTAGGSLEAGRIPYGQTFLRIDGPPTREKALDAISKGRSMISFGPAVFCTVLERDKGLGSVLPTDGRPLTLQIRAYSTMDPGAQLEKIEIIRNGVVVHALDDFLMGESETHDLRYPISERNTAWYVIRVTERLNGAPRGTALRRAWTSPIFFRGPAFAESLPALSRVHGRLTKNGVPVSGVVTAIAAGMPTQRFETDDAGQFSLTLPASGTLIFEAPECEAVARRIFEHPKVQRAIGKQMTAGNIWERLAERGDFNRWRFLLSDLEWDLNLNPIAIPRDASKLPEPQ